MARLILGPNQPVIEEIRQAARRHPGGRLRILVAWAREEGALRLLEALGGRINDLQLIVGLNEKNTTVEALLRLLPHVRLLKTFLKHPSQTFHPKLYWFDDGLEPSETTTLIVGSSNLTRGGLVTNFEASLIADIVGPNLREEDLQLLASVAQKWTELLNSPFASVVPGVNRMRELYESGYLVLERTIRRRKRQAVRTEAPLGTLPTAPPPPVQPPLMEPILIPFPLKREDETEPVLGENVDPAGAQPLPDRFFVRTLTDNDIEKLHGRTPGTFEPDLGETARDRFPAFWGWPRRYQQVTRRLTRREWNVRGRLISSLTPPEGIPVEAMLWYRPERPGHAAEHRLRPGPISRVRQAVPTNFNTTSLLVVERAPQAAAYDFVIRLITAGQPGYEDFNPYLVEQRPQHRFGYGP